MSVPVRNPENYCPICGSHLPQVGKHRCNSRDLCALDAARRRGINPADAPSVGQRLNDGFRFSESLGEADKNEVTLICPACKQSEILHWF